jgi:heavy metal efflux system protein
MLDNIIKYSIQNKLMIGLMTLLLIVWGVWSATKLPIDALPDITDNQVQIITQAPTLATQEVEQVITSPIEKAMANLPDVVEMRSFSRFGLSVITIVFKDEMDVYFARQLISEKLKQAEKEIPAAMGVPMLAPVTTGLGEVFQYVIHPKKGSEDKYNPMNLRTLQDWVVARQLYGIEGVAEVAGFGGVTKQYEVAVNPERLRAMQVSIPDIYNALAKNNENTGGAYIDKKPNAYFIRGVGMVKTFADIENIIVKNSANGTPILIRDVATVQFGNPPRFGALTYNGEKEVVGGIVMMTKGANSNAVVQGVKERMKTVQASLPDDIIIEPFLDRTNLVNRAIGTVQKNLIEGALIVIFVLILFLGNLRAGLIVASAIPLALLFAMGLMNLFGVSANLMSLGAIDFGLIVDGAVIIVEATMHHLGLRKKTGVFTQVEMDEEVFTAASKIRSSAAFGEIIILIVYLPILTLVGIEGKMFRPMAQTVGFSILGALILSLTYIPMMSALFLSKKTQHKENFSDRMMRKLENMYLPLLQKAMQLKKIIIGFTLVLFVVSIFVFSKMGGEFIPELEEGDYAIEFGLPQGSSLSQTIETIMQAEKIIKKFPEVKMVVGKTGSADVATDPMPIHASDIMVILKDKEEWKTKSDFYELAEEMKEKLQTIPGVIAEPSQPIQMRFNELMTGIKQDVAIKIFGENMDTLNVYAKNVSKSISNIQGITAPQVEKVSGLPQISIEYDRNRMAVYGINVEDVNHVISTAFAGEEAGVVYEDERKFDLVVRLDSAHRTSLDDVSHLAVPDKNGNQIPLSQIANVSYKLGPAQISRENGKRRIYVAFNVNGRDVQSVVKDIQVKLQANVKLPVGYYYTYGGTFENLQQASKRLMIAVPVALLLIFMLLYFTFKNIKQASLIFTAIPMSAIGGVFALLLRGMPFSISAGIGFIALFGVAVLNGIVLIGTFNDLEKEGITDIYKRVMEGTKIRLRPVLMTALVASLGFLPMALSSSSGAEVQKPLATVVIGGLLSATFLTLFVLPLMYILFNSSFSFSKKNIRTIAILLILFTASNTTKAQTTTTLTIDQAIAIALKNNGDLKSLDYEKQALKQKRLAAKEFAKTAFNLQLGQYNSYRIDHAIQIAQNIPFPFLFKAKRGLVDAYINNVSVLQKLNAAEIKRQVKTYYYYIEYLEFNQQKLLLLDTMYQEYVRVASLRYKTGDIKKVEINTAELKQGEVALLLQQNETALLNNYNGLKALLQESDNIRIQPTTVSYQPLSMTIVLDTSRLQDLPIIQNLYNEARILEQQRMLTIAENKPELNVGYTNQSLIGFQNVNGNDVFYNGAKRFNVFNIGMALPLLNGKSNKAKIKQITLEQDAINAKAEQEKQIIKAQIQNALQQYQLALQQYNYHKNKALPSVTEILKAAQLGYKVGEIDYVEYLFALQTNADIHLKYLQSIQDVNSNIIQILNITNN